MEGVGFGGLSISSQPFVSDLCHAGITKWWPSVWKVLQLSVKWVRWYLAPLSLRPWFSDVGWEWVPAQVVEFKYLVVLFRSEGRREWEIFWQIGATPAVMCVLHWSVMITRADREAEAVDLLDTLHSCSHFWPCGNRKNETVDISACNKIPPKDAWAQC